VPQTIKPRKNVASYVPHNRTNEKRSTYTSLKVSSNHPPKRRKTNLNANKDKLSHNSNDSTPLRKPNGLDHTKTSTQPTNRDAAKQNKPESKSTKLQYNKQPQFPAPRPYVSDGIITPDALFDSFEEEYNDDNNSTSEDKPKKLIRTIHTIRPCDLEPQPLGKMQPNRKKVPEPVQRRPPIKSLLQRITEGRKAVISKKPKVIPEKKQPRTQVSFEPRIQPPKQKVVKTVIKQRFKKKVGNDTYFTTNLKMNPEAKMTQYNNKPLVAHVGGSKIPRPMRQKYVNVAFEIFKKIFPESVQKAIKATLKFELKEFKKCANTTSYRGTMAYALKSLKEKVKKLGI